MLEPAKNGCCSVRTAFYLAGNGGLWNGCGSNHGGIYMICVLMGKIIVSEHREAEARCINKAMTK